MLAKLFFDESGQKESLRIGSIPILLSSRFFPCTEETFHLKIRVRESGYF